MSGCRYAEIKNVEVYGMVGSSTAGGTGVGVTGREGWPESTLEVAVTAPGVQSVTPVSMDNIAVGRYVVFGSWGSIDEFCLVTARTATTFTCDVVGTYAVGHPVWVWDYSISHSLIEDCYVHDCENATAFGSAGSYMTFRRCVARNGGYKSTEHAFYIQGGSSLFEDCFAEAWYGYHFHNHSQVPRVEGSANRYIGCHSLNPGTMHLYNSALTNSGGSPDNPEVPTGALLNRGIIVDGCVFRGTNGLTKEAISLNTDQAIVSNCLFEDAWGVSINTATPSAEHITGIITGNTFRSLYTVPPTYNIRLNGLGGICSNNHFYIDGSLGTSYDLIRLDEGSQCFGNHVYATSTDADFTAIVVNGADKIAVHDNQVILTGSGLAMSIAKDATNLSVKNNMFTTDGTYIVKAISTGVTGIMENNWFVGDCYYDVSLPNFILKDNKGNFHNHNRSGVAVEPGSGILHQFTVGAGGVSDGRVISSAYENVATSATSWFGVSTAGGAGGENGFAVITPGAICYVYSDDVWTAGNLARVSTTVAGKVHDVGTTGDMRMVVGVFLDSGLAAGLAKIQLI
jgi:hypothetical protein